MKTLTKRGLMRVRSRLTQPQLPVPMPLSHFQSLAHVMERGMRLRLTQPQTPVAVSFSRPPGLAHLSEWKMRLRLARLGIPLAVSLPHPPLLTHILKILTLKIIALMWNLMKPLMMIHLQMRPLMKAPWKLSGQNSIKA